MLEAKIRDGFGGVIGVGRISIFEKSLAERDLTVAVGFIPRKCVRWLASRSDA